MVLDGGRCGGRYFLCALVDPKHLSVYLSLCLSAYLSLCLPISSISSIDLSQSICLRDIEGLNTKPSHLTWQRPPGGLKENISAENINHALASGSSSVVGVKSAGLYRLAVAIFTGMDCTIDVLLNGSSILSKVSD